MTSTMGDVAIVNSEVTEVSEKPVPVKEEIKFPPFPDPKDEDFDEDIPEEERNHYKIIFKDLNAITSMKLHCSACDRHLGCSARNDNRMRIHPMLRTLVCQTCHTFYNSGEFEKGDDGSELYCRWCGQGGQVYCCSDCPHVFCAKCIKRNLGAPKIKEIEALDDWKCFKCNNKCLWDLRALCWAVIRYCDLKNKITYEVEDPVLKEAYQKSCAQDYSECCKNKIKRREKQEAKKKEVHSAKSTANVYPKLPPQIQVKKFASINIEEPVKQEKKAQKRAASPKNKVVMKTPVAIPNKMITHLSPSMPKKIRMSSSPVINPVRFNNDRKITPNFACYTRIRPKAPQMPIMYNGYNSSPTFNDNINLSLECLTQGLDMSAMAAIAGPSQDDDVVCTPDFPLEPLCEVTEDNGDDDVQCITPGPVAAPKPAPAPAPVPRTTPLPDLNADNIIQMTDNDVTVNASTGGLKFRVDPQTLSSNKMYRLPDGRIFAINANPNMPGGYSATIVAVTDSNQAKVPPKGTTFAAKLSAVPSINTPPLLKYGNRNQSNRNPKRSTPKPAKANRTPDTPSRVCDLNVPVEWYRYNLVDAIDALEYSLSRLHQLKRDATTMHLRTRSVNEMRLLHRSLERSLTTSMTRFKEIRDNLNKEYKQYVTKKTATPSATNSDDDDVEILHEDVTDDPIYIDENSMESTQNDNQEVDLTVAGSSDLNDSSDKSLDKIDPTKDPLSTDPEIGQKEDNSEYNTLRDTENGVRDNEHLGEDKVPQTDSKTTDDDKIISDEIKSITKDNEDSQEEPQKEGETDEKNEISTTAINGQTEHSHESEKIDKLDEENILNENSDNEKKTIDAEMSDEMIEDLLKEDNAGNDDDMAGNGDDLVGNSKDASSNDDDAAGNGDNATRYGNDAADNDDDAAGNGHDAAGNGDDAAGNGGDVAGNAGDRAGKSSVAASNGDNAASNVDDAVSNGDDTAGNGNATDVHSLDVSDDIQGILESEKD